MAERWRLDIQGIVQGVGFRPLVYTMAQELRLGGFVLNHSAGVRLELEGPPHALETFVAQLPHRLPPAARIDELQRNRVTPLEELAFQIQPSQGRADRSGIPPDLAPCPECLRELNEPDDRRFAYPFLNCTACGPRYTIVESLPYDRERTSLRDFQLCADCSQEYHNPLDRRFHAQPTACPACGPRLSRSVTEVVEALSQGKVVILKGVGGYHMLGRADRPDCVEEIRVRKHRPHRPLALMFPDLAQARQWVELNQEMEQLLSSPARPILLAPARRDISLWAPGQRQLGVMLPYSPLHALICKLPLVVTSANLSGEPLAVRADPRLESMAELVVHHDRPIQIACEDSVWQWGPRGPLPLRRSRGYVPGPLSLNQDCQPTLAVGGELKATIALVRGRQAWLSGHIGDVANLETLNRLEENLEHLQTLLNLRPTRVAADMHPGYLSSDWARRRAAQQNLTFVEVQHHHAHLASLLAEQAGPARPALGLILDGTGWGTDGAIWGGEVLLGDCRGYERLAHLSYQPLAGGDAGVRNPCRLALEYLHASHIPIPENLPSLLAASALERGNLGKIKATPCSSMGRLFDVVASLLGVCQRTSYEGQAAMELESYCDEDPGALEFPWSGNQLDSSAVLSQLVEGWVGGIPSPTLASRFHNGLVLALVEAARRWGRGLPIALSGGCFQNQRLLGRAVVALEKAGFEVLVHRLVPPNDGGLALGQATIAGRCSD